MAWISAVLILGEVLIPLASTMYRAAKPGGSATIVYVIGGGLTAFIAIIAIAYLSVLSHSVAVSNGIPDGNPMDVINMNLALNVFYFIATLIAIAMLLGFLVMMRKATPLGSLVVTIPLLCIMLFAAALTTLIISAKNKSNPSFSFASLVCEIFFSDLFNAGIFILLLIIGENSTIMAALNDPNKGQTNPVAPGTEQPHPGAYPMYQQQPGVPAGQPIYVYPQGQPGMQPVMMYPQQQHMAPGAQPQYYQPMPMQQQHAPGAGSAQHGNIAPVSGERAVSPPAREKMEMDGTETQVAEMQSNKGSELP
jgi:hypothetical protein